MNLSKKWPYLLMGAGMATFGGLWVSESFDTFQLSGDLALAKNELSKAEASLKQLRNRNQLLQLQLRELPLLEFSEKNDQDEAGRRGQLPSTEWDEADTDEDDDQTAASGSAPARDESGAPGSEERERTPEEEAERAARRAERQQRREEYRQQMTMDLQDRREFFSRISLEGLAPEYAEANIRLIEAMGEMQVLLADMGQEGLSRDERRELWGGLRENSREVRSLMDTQKEILLFDYAEVELGLDAEKQQEFLDYMKTVEAFTTMPRRSWRGR